MQRLPSKVLAGVATATSATPTTTAAEQYLHEAQSSTPQQQWRCCGQNDEAARAPQSVHAPSRALLRVVFLLLAAAPAVGAAVRAAAATPVAVAAAAGAAVERKTRLPEWVVVAASPLGSGSSPCRSSQSNK